jgi:dTDP-4-dehydrorhamnose 3,5-epimerase
MGNEAKTPEADGARPDWSGAAPQVAGEADPEDRSRPRRDPQLATPDGRQVGDLIHGVMIREARTIPDHRGSICVAFDPRWGWTEEPIVYTYLVTIRPGAVKGWIVHGTYDDRLLLYQGAVKWVLYDGREDSPTHGLVNELFFDDHHRALLRIPRGVWHAVQNLGSVDSLMLNHPTEPYDYETPDKTRLPLDTELIPYSF